MSRLLLRQPNFRLVVLIFSCIILFAGLFLSDYVIDKLIDFKKKYDETAINITTITSSRVRLLENELPPCSGNFLDQRDFYYPKNTNGPYDSDRLISQSGSCKLRPFTVDVIINFSRIKFEGMAVHHMVPILEGDQYKFFQKRLLELGPFLGRLSQTSNVIWLNQYPTLELYGERVRNYHIYADKIHRYNEGVRRILQNYSTIQIWDSSNSLAEEYVRGCTIFKRDLKAAPNKTITDYATAYVNCDDYIHPGYSALSKATQLLYNQICNNAP